MIYMQVMEVLRGRGVTLKPFALAYSVNAEDIIMNVMVSEAAAHFDYWQRSGQDALNRRQDYWPPLLRLARLIPAVEYIQVCHPGLSLGLSYSSLLALHAAARHMC